MVPVFLRMIITALLSILAVILYAICKTEPRKDAMTAMLLSSVGDVFMVNSASIGEFATYIGAAAFIAAHIVYGECFRKQIKKRNAPFFNPAFIIGGAIMLISAAVLGYLAFTVPEQKKPVMFVLILFYIAAIGYNVCSEFSFAKVFGGIAWLLPFAVLAFYLTDYFIFEDMLNINHSLRQYVWLIYPEAQLLIVLLSSSLKRNK